MAAIAKSKTPVSKVMDELNKCRLDNLKYLPLLCSTPCTGGIGQRERDDISDYRVHSSIIEVILRDKSTFHSTNIMRNCYLFVLTVSR